jgi:putative transposase
MKKMTKIQLVERHQIISKDIDILCFLSKNLYNRANYCLRQSFIATKTLPNEFELTGKLAKRFNVDYKALPAQTSQQIIKLLYKNWKSFFASVKEYRKNPSKFLGQPKLPKYKDKLNGRNIIIFSK